MSTDGLLPARLSYVSQGRHIPVVATCIACFVIALLATFFDIKVRSKFLEKEKRMIFVLYKRI